MEPGGIAFPTALGWTETRHKVTKTPDFRDRAHVHESVCMFDLENPRRRLFLFQEIHTALLNFCLFLLLIRQRTCVHTRAFRMTRIERGVHAIKCNFFSNVERAGIREEENAAEDAIRSEPQAAAENTSRSIGVLNVSGCQAHILASDLLGNTPYYFELSFHSQAMARVTSKEFRLHPRLIPQKM